MHGGAVRERLQERGLLELRAAEQEIRRPLRGRHAPHLLEHVRVAVERPAAREAGADDAVEVQAAVAGEVLDARRRVGDRDSGRQARPDEARHRDLAPPHPARGLRVDGGEARGRQRAEDDEEPRRAAEERALEPRVRAREPPRRHAEPGGREGEEARERPDQVAVEVHAGVDVRAGRREGEKDGGEPGRSGRAHRRGRGRGREQDEGEAERREREGRLAGPEADRRFRRVEPQQQAAQHVDAVLRADREALDGAVARRERLAGDRRARASCR